MSDASAVGPTLKAVYARLKANATIGAKVFSDPVPTIESGEYVVVRKPVGTTGYRTTSGRRQRIPVSVEVFSYSPTPDTMLAWMSIVRQELTTNLDLSPTFRHFGCLEPAEDYDDEMTEAGLRQRGYFLQTFMVAAL